MNFMSIAEGGFLMRLAIDLVCVFALVRGVYYNAYRRADLFLTFFAFNLAIFLISFVLNRTEMSMGAAFGLFAVFSMLRYRTEGISTTDMTYLFLAIALGLIMAVANAGPAALVGLGILIVVFTLLLETGWLNRREVRQEILYDQIRLLHADERIALIADLKTRTGLDVRRVDVEEIDLVRDCARLAIYYYPEQRRGVAQAEAAARAEEAPRRTPGLG